MNEMPLLLNNNDRKYIKSLAVKKTTYTEVNALSANQI